MNTSLKTKRLVLTAVLIALSTVLSMIKIFQLPMGGSVTLLSMLPLTMISIIYGVKWGVIAAFLDSIIQMFLSLGNLLAWGLSPVVLICAVLLDYILAYTVIGLSGMFRIKGTKGICAGIALSMFLRFLCHFCSGFFLFSTWCPEGWNAALYSLCYNGGFMLPEMIFTMIGAVILYRLPQVKKLMGI